MDAKLESILQSFRMVKYPFSKIEKDLGFSNGLIGKVAKGQSNLSQEKIDKLVDYFGAYIAGTDSVTLSQKVKVDIPATNVAINKVAEFSREDSDGSYHGVALYSMEKIKELTQIEGVTTGDKVPPPSMEEIDSYFSNRKEEKRQWSAIKDFCEKEGITPEDLIESYKNRNKPVKEKASDVLKGSDKGSGGVVYDRRKIKMGF